MKTASARAKGKRLEDYVADQIVAKGIDLKARRDGGSGNGNREKGDVITSMMILGQNVGIECKNQKNIAIQDWWRQTKQLEKLSREPVLVFKIENEPWEETKCVVYLDTLLELTKQASGEKEVVYQVAQDSNDKKWAIQNAIVYLKKVLKYYE